jgi:hypothetical protein
MPNLSLQSYTLLLLASAKYLALNISNPLYPFQVVLEHAVSFVPIDIREKFTYCLLQP